MSISTMMQQNKQKNVNEWFGIGEAEQTVFIQARTHKGEIASNLDIYLAYIYRSTQ